MKLKVTKRWLIIFFTVDIIFLLLGTVIYCIGNYAVKISFTPGGGIIPLPPNSGLGPIKESWGHGFGKGFSDLGNLDGGGAVQFLLVLGLLFFLLFTFWTLGGIIWFAIKHLNISVEQPKKKKSK